MTTLQRISSNDSNAQGDVIFLHGLGGSWDETWSHTKEDRASFWPAWLAEDLPHLAVHSLAYEASPSKWLGAGMPLVDRATNVLTRLEADGIGTRPLVFVCHSLGGLLAKQILRSGLELGEAPWRTIAEQTRGIVFLATPHTGARLADYMSALGKVLRQTVTAKELENNAPALRDLNLWYRGNLPERGVDTLAFYETQNTMGARVVDEVSADAGTSVPRGIDADHVTICKPRSREDLVYAISRRFISRRLGEHGVGAEPSVPTTSMVSTDSAALARVFVSYNRRTREDAVLADALHTALAEAGHEVFIDKTMETGTDWVAEIERRIARCDYLVVLLSETSMQSEMVLGEVRMAHRRRRHDGSPRILPIRLRYDGPLDYELDSYLAQIEYTFWSSDADTAAVVKNIAAVTEGSAQPEVGANDQPVMAAAPPDQRGRPQPAEDARRLFPPPGGAIKLDDKFFISRPVDVVVAEAATRLGETFVIKAPRQVGKSSLLVRYLAQCVAAGKKFAFLDFQSFTDVQLDHYPTLLSEMARHLLRGFRLTQVAPPALESQADLTYFIEDVILPQVDAPIVLAFDEVDRVLGRPYQGDFFSMLRLWHNRRAEPLSPWENVDLALVISTEPYLLINREDCSPFNVTVPVSPEPFDRDALYTLNQRYDSPLRSNNEIEDLHELVGGQPFLTRLALFRLATDRDLSFNLLDKQAADPEGPFGDHLRALLVRLQQQPGLLPAMGQVIRHGTVPDDEAYYRLHGAGLVNRREGRIAPANMVYARFFRGLEISGGRTIDEC